MAVFSFVCAFTAIVCLFLLVVKYPLRKLGMHKLNAFLMNLHEAASAGFFLFSQLHMAAELFRKQGSRFQKATGAAGLALSTWLIADCHMAKDKSKKMIRHRWYSLFLVIGVALHAFCALCALPSLRKSAGKTSERS